jgi:hypothetical protein
MSSEATLPCPDGPKMTRETLCVAQHLVALTWPETDRSAEHVRRLAKLIDACDVHRPI